MAQTSGSRLGFIVENVDCKKLSSQDVQMIKNALWDNGMICIKDQNLSAAEQVEFSKLFGEVIERPPFYAQQFREPGYPAIIRVGTVGVDGSIIDKAQDAELWHKDCSFEQPGKNFVLSFLHPKIITSIGGQTGFVDCEETYNRLSEKIKEELAGATVRETSMTNSFFKGGMNAFHYPDSHHQIFQKHPVNGKPLIFISHKGYEIKLRDGTKVLSDSYVEELEASYQVHPHKWQQGDFVIWDNYRVIHKSMGGYGNHPRLFYRTQVRLKVDDYQQGSA